MDTLILPGSNSGAPGRPLAQISIAPSIASVPEIAEKNIRLSMRWRHFLHKALPGGQPLTRSAATSPIHLHQD